MVKHIHEQFPQEALLVLLVLAVLDVFLLCNDEEMNDVALPCRFYDGLPKRLKVLL